MNSFPVRLLILVAVHAAAFAAFWAIVAFGLVDQSSLAQAVLERLNGEPARIEMRLDDLRGQMLVTGAAAIGLAAVFGLVWLVLIQIKPPFDDKSARAKMGSWAALLLAALAAAAGAGWYLLVSAPIAQQLANGVPLQATVIAAALAIVGYWLGTGLGAPASCKVAVPGFGR